MTEEPLTDSARWNAPGAGAARFVTEPELPVRLKLLRHLGRQTWMRKGHDRLLRLLFHPESGNHFFFDVDFFGQRYRGDLGHYIDWVVFCYGAAPYKELSLLRAVSNYLRESGEIELCFADVGANAGHHTLFMGAIADWVISFEPLPGLRRLIQEKVSFNGLKNVEIVPFALGEADEILPYYPSTGANSGAGTFLPLDGIRATIGLQVRNGDRLFEECGWPRVRLMKVDVEGFEPFVFRGLADRIASDRPVIMTEMSDEARRGFGSETAFRELFYDGAIFLEVEGRHGCDFTLGEFDYESSAELLILPPELSDFRREIGPEKTGRIRK